MTEEQLTKLLGIWAGEKYKDCMLPAAGAMTCGKAAEAIAKFMVSRSSLVDVLVCGACGDIWQDGMSCGQKDNGHPFPTCYPHPRSPQVTETP